MDAMITNFGERHFGNAPLGHKKRTHALVKIANSIHRHPGETLPKKLHSPKVYKSMDRLVNRPEVTHTAVLHSHRELTRAKMRTLQRPVLIVHDTTELDYSGLHSIDDLGPIGNGGGRGLLCHNSLAIDPKDKSVIGLANQRLHQRVAVGKKEGVKAKRNRLSRESRLWTQAALEIGPAPANSLWVDVADRGADLFEFLAQEVAHQRHFVVRSCSSRAIYVGHGRGADEGEKQLVHSYARSLPLRGRERIQVSAREKRPERQATIGVAWAAVQVLPPHVRRGEYEKRPLPLWVVRVAEIDPPAGVPPVEWILLTNVPVTTIAEAFERVRWYSCRWVIEEYHKGQKTGCAVEKLQFTSRQALEPMIALLSVVAVTLLNLRDASRQPDAKERRATEVIDARYVKVLSMWRHDEVREDWSVHDFYYALARLGGHQNRKNDKVPGWLILWRAWMDLQHMVNGASIGSRIRG
jgi:hypothetical protein